MAAFKGLAGRVAAGIGKPGHPRPFQHLNTGMASAFRT
jgi:hypothetical protein